MKRVLVIAQNKPAEALRVAAGLYMLHSDVRVLSAGALPDDAAVREQRELLEFAEVPCEEIADPADVPARLAAAIVAADVVYRI